MADHTTKSGQHPPTKNQHIVPRLHLRFFAFDEARKHVYCLQKEKNRIIPPSVKDICYSEYFYDGPNDSTLPVDPVLTTIETMVGPVYGRIVGEGANTKLSDTERYLFALFIATLELRTRPALEAFSQVLTCITGVKAGDADVKALQKTALDFTSPHGHAEFIADKIYPMKWGFIENASRIRFCTSDHPVVRVNKKHGWPPPRIANIDAVSLDNPDVAVLLPMSPTLCLVIQSPKNLCERYDVKSFPHYLNVHSYLGCEDCLICDDKKTLEAFIKIDAASPGPVLEMNWMRD